MVGVRGVGGGDRGSVDRGGGVVGGSRISAGVGNGAYSIRLHCYRHAHAPEPIKLCHIRTELLKNIRVPFLVGKEGA